MFFYRFADAQKRIVIGDATATDLDAARKKARQYRVALDNQKDPAAEKINNLAAAELTFSKIVDKYLEVRATDMRPRALVEDGSRYTASRWAASPARSSQPDCARLPRTAARSAPTVPAARCRPCSPGASGRGCVRAIR